MILFSFPWFLTQDLLSVRAQDRDNKKNNKVKIGREYLFYEFLREVVGK